MVGRGRSKITAVDAAKKAISKNRYLLWLLLIAALYSIFFYFFMATHDNYLSTHEYEHYTRSVLMLHSKNIKEFADYFLWSLPDKIIMARSVPFMYLFGETRFVFRLSSIALNLCLTLILYLFLKKIMDEKMAFLFILLVMSSYFYLETLPSPYVDLTFYLLCSIYYIQLYQAVKSRNVNPLLIPTVFLLFLSRNTSYLLVPFVFFSVMIYLFILHRSKMWKVAGKLIAFHLLGFLIFFLVLGFFNEKVLVFEMDVTVFNMAKGHSNSIVELAQGVMKFISMSGVRAHPGFLKVFPNLALTLVLYLLFLASLIRKRLDFWNFLFLASIIFMFGFFNILRLEPSENKYFLPFYFVYQMILFRSLCSVMDTLGIFKDGRSISSLLIAGFLLLFNLAILFAVDVPIYSIPHGKITVDINRHIFSNLPLGSGVFIDGSPFGEVPPYYEGNSNFLDLVGVNGTYLSGLDPRFRFRIVDSVNKSDYVLCAMCGRLDLRNHELIETYKIDGYIDRNVECCRLSLYKKK